MSTPHVTSTAAVLVATIASFASADIVGFTENFATGSAGWRNAGGTVDLDWAASGGPDGGAFATSVFNLSGTTPGGFPPTVIRAHAAYGSSDGAYVGNWIEAGVTGVSFWFRHDLAEAITVTGRFATPNNTPGASVVSFTPIAANTWTLVTFDLTEGSSQIVSLGGGTYSAIFSNVGNMQFGFTVPPSLAGTDVDGRFDIAGFTIVPAPGALALLGLAGIAPRRRR
ncbi:MAG: hypothetical protein RIS86_1887 [Planctomycetota bacterium]|jgi:hypothetical protein